MIVPVSITYDKLMERNFVRHELMVSNASKPSLFVVVVVVFIVCSEYVVDSSSF